MLSWTLNDALCPKTSSACREGTADAVFLIRFKKLAAPARSTGREIKILKTLAKRDIFRLIPYILNISVRYIPDSMPAKIPFISVKI